MPISCGGNCKEIFEKDQYIRDELGIEVSPKGNLFGIIPLTVSLVAAAAAKSLQSCLTLCDLIDGSPPGSSVPGSLQARTLEWVAISFSNAGK